VASDCNCTHTTRCVVRGWKVPLLAEHGKHASRSSRTRSSPRYYHFFSFIAHHFRSSIILDSESILYPLYHFIYYKNPMYTTFSVVESIPPLTSRRRRPVSFSPPVFKSHQVALKRIIQFTFTFTHAQSSSREAIYLHAQFTAHEEHPAGILAPPLAQHTHREFSFDSQTIRSFYSLVSDRTLKNS